MVDGREAFSADDEGFDGIEGGLVGDGPRRERLFGFLGGKRRKDVRVLSELR